MQSRGRLVLRCHRGWSSGAPSCHDVLDAVARDQGQRPNLAELLDPLPALAPVHADRDDLEPPAVEGLGPLDHADADLGAFGAAEEAGLVDGHAAPNAFL